MAQFRRRACRYDKHQAIFAEFSENQFKLGTDQIGTMFASGGFVIKTAERFKVILFKTRFVVKHLLQSCIQSLDAIAGEPR
jgi:hypothetical protein